MDSLLLKVYKSPYKKLRLGREYDGGYIICDIPDVKYDCLLAGGIENDLSFEEHFCEKYPVPCLAYDGTINSINTKCEHIKFIRLNIGTNQPGSKTDLHDVIDKYDNVFVKMDIEGGEIEWIETLSEQHMDKFSQIVMEFHHPFSTRESDVFRKINKTHALVHFHPNNCCGTRDVNGVQVPNVFECSYLHKKYIQGELESNIENIPSELDMKNLKNKEDIYIDYPPFVNKL